MLRRSKYKAKKTEIDGIKFASKLEADCYSFLKKINVKNLELQPKFLLQEKFRIGKKTHRRIDYIADFKFDLRGITYIIDTKGFETSVFKLKKKLLLCKYRDLDFYTVKSVKKLKELLGFPV